MRPSLVLCCESSCCWLLTVGVPPALSLCVGMLTSYRGFWDKRVGRTTEVGVQEDTLLSLSSQKCAPFFWSFVVKHKQRVKV